MATENYIIDPKTIEGPRKYSISVIGEAKSGKTEFMCTSPNPLFIQWDTNRDNVISWDHKYIDLSQLEPQVAIDRFNKEVMPKIYNREYDFDTICFDCWNAYSSTLQRTIPVGRTNQGGLDLRPHYRKLKQTQEDLTPKIQSITQPFPGDPSRRRYNLIVSYHMVPETTDILDPKGNVVGTKLNRWVPDIEGGFKNKLMRVTGSVFWVEKEKDEKGDFHHFMYTKDPDKYRKADDSVGGKGKYNRLPPKIENTWQALMSGWGVGDGG